VQVLQDGYKFTPDSHRHLCQAFVKTRSF